MEASRSGFCEYLGRKKSSVQIGREALEGFVAEAFERHKGRCGCRRINRELRKSGIAASEDRVLRIMRKPRLAGRGATRKRRIQKKVEPGDPRLNLVERAFAAGGRNRLRVGGIACMPAREGWLYLAAVTGAFSRKVVGWSMSGRIAEKAATDAIGGRLAGRILQTAAASSSMAIKVRSAPRLPTMPGIVQPASRPGTPPDNAAAEPFFMMLKGESVEGRSHGTRDGAKRGIFKRIELYYNRVRMHSTLGYMPPVEYERQYA